ncbi:MAG: TatD family hydrolase [Fibrobacter sp.]|nr:TatD family hydrolase [Fibrobacter sp.]
MFDFHLHLARLHSPIQTGAALLEGGDGFNNVACEPWEWNLSLDLMEKLKKQGPNFHSFFGIHPMIASTVTSEEWNRLEQILRARPEIQVGECGLDRRYPGYEDGDIQEQALLRQFEFAKELGRSVQIHCVGDYSRVLRLTEPYARQIPQVVFHRFGGDISVVRSALRLLGDRAVFSLHGDSFRKKSTRNSIAEIPAGQIRLETDGDNDSWTAERVTNELLRLRQAMDSLAGLSPTAP